MNVGAELRTYINILLHYKWVIIICVVMSIGITLLLTNLLTPLYKVEATLRVASALGAEAGDVWVVNSLATRMMNTFVEIATSGPVLDELAVQLGHNTLPTVEAEVIPETELIKITIWHPNAAVAYSAANILANMMVERSLQLYGGDAPTAREILEGQVEQAKADLDAATVAYEVALIKGLSEGQLEALQRLVWLRQDIYADLLGRYENARVSETLRGNAISIVELSPLPTKPTKPNIPINIALGLVGGLTVGVMVAFFLESMDTSLRTLDEIKNITSLPVLARVPEFRSKLLYRNKSKNPKSNSQIISQGVYHHLMTRLLSIKESSPYKIILVTSPEPGVGKSIVSIHLSQALARAGRRVILVDANLRNPNLQDYFRLPNDPGLSTILAGKTVLGPDIPGFRVTPKLRVLTAGRSLNDPSALFKQGKVKTLLLRLAAKCDHVVIDSPAILSAAESRVLATQAETVVLVVALRHTESENLSQAVEQLDEMDAKVEGLVVNRIPSPSLRKYS